MALPASDLKGYPFFGGVGFNDFFIKFNYFVTRSNQNN